MLTLKNITVSIGDKEIIHALDYTFPSHEITAILGHNGSGKSSLALAIMGHPRYTTQGIIMMDGEDLSTLSPTERHAKGIFLSFQNIPEIPGIKVSEYLRTIYNAHFSRHNIDKKSPSPFVFRRMLLQLLPSLGLDEAILDRDLFVGFSGGEKRRIELLQIALLDPSVIVLDEIDSGLDIDALDVLSERIRQWDASGKTIILITHNFHLLDSIHLKNILVMKDGVIERTGTGDLLSDIRKQGFQ